MYVSRKHGTDEEKGKLLRSRSSQEDDPDQPSPHQPPSQMPPPLQMSPSPSSQAAANEVAVEEVASLSPSPSACAASHPRSDTVSMSSRHSQRDQQHKHRIHHQNQRDNDSNSSKSRGGRRPRSQRKRHADSASSKMSPTSGAADTAVTTTPTSTITRPTTTATSKSTITTTTATTPTKSATAATTTTTNRLGGKRKLTPQGSLESKASTGTRDTIKSTASASRRNATPLQPKVIYYNNRFITITSVADKHQHGISNNNKNTSTPGSSEQQSRAAKPGSRVGPDAHARGGDAALHLGDAERHVTDADSCGDAALMPGDAADDADIDKDTPAQIHCSSRPNPAGNMEQSNSISMQNIDVDTGQGFVKDSWANTFLAKLSEIIQDNRMRDGDKNTAKKLKEMNRNQEQRHQILKRVLNVIFVTTGIFLFLAVIVVIIYTSFAPAGTEVRVDKIEKLPTITTSVQEKVPTLKASPNISKRKKKKNRKKNNSKRKKNRGKKKGEAVVLPQ